VHALLVVTSLALVVATGAIALRLLPRVRGWSERRDVQMLVLAAPLVSLGTAIAALRHFSGLVCWLGAPPWDFTLGLVLPLAMGAVASAAPLLGLARLALLHRAVRRASFPAGAELQATADRLAAQMGAPRVGVRVCLGTRPLALTHGWWRPTLLLSTWMLDELDTQELAAVLSHELGHAARRDSPVTWLAAVLRDAFCYLPTSHAAFRHLRRDRELACDDAAAGATHQPLALAGALAKVWQFALGGAQSAQTGPLGGGLAAQVATALFDSADAREGGASIERRIERLLVPVADTRSQRHRSLGSQVVALGVGSSALGGLLALEAANAAVMLGPMGCGPHAPLVSLLTRLV
jgi:Zn-dependent protease with chaperone function